MIEEQQNHRYLSMADFSAKKITAASENPDFNRAAFPLTGAAFEVVLSQMTNLLKGLESEFDFRQLDDPRKILSDDEVENAEFDDPIEKNMEQLISLACSKIIPSIKNFLSRKTYQPHNKYGEQGVFIRREITRTDLVPAIKIIFHPLSLRNFNSVTNENLGLSPAVLYEKMENEIQPARTEAGTVLQRMNDQINGVVLGWSADTANTNIHEKPAGFTIQFGSVRKDGFEPITDVHTQSEISFQIQIRYDQELGLCFIPIIRFKNPKTKAKGQHVAFEGTSTPIKIAENKTTQEIVNQSAAKELEALKK